MIDINDGGKLRPEEYEAIKSRTFPLAGLIEAAVQKEIQLLDDPIEWYRAHVGTFMHRFILSHPDMDHMSGIRRLLSHDSGIEVCNFWDYDHKRKRTEADYPNNDAGWLDWQWYYGFHIQSQWDGVIWPKRISPLRGETNNYWAEDSIEILSPTTSLIADCDTADEYNNASYVIRIGHGATSHVLAPGDAEDKAWNDMLATGMPLRANVLIASHHGRNSGYNEDALDAIKPEVVIISSDVIPAKDDAIEKYKKRSRVFSTREHGTLTVRMHTNDGLVQILDRNGNELYWMADQVAV